MVVLLGLDSQVSEVAAPSLRDEWLRRATVAFLPHEILNLWGLGECQRWVLFQAPRGAFGVGQSYPYTRITALGGWRGRLLADRKLELADRAC